MVIDLSTCEKGDLLITSQGTILKYICKTPWGNYTYLDHVVQFIVDDLGNDVNEYNDTNHTTRTNDGFAFAKNRIPETDHDVVKIIRLKDSI